MITTWSSNPWEIVWKIPEAFVDDVKEIDVSDDVPLFIEIEVESGNVKDYVSKDFAQLVGRKLEQCSQDNCEFYRLITEAYREEDNLDSNIPQDLFDLTKQ